MTTNPTISVSTISDVYHTLIEHGVAPDVLARQTGVTLAQVQDLDARIPISYLSEVWEIAAELTDDPAIGLQVGSKIDPARFSVVAQAAFQCDTVRDVLNMYARFFSIVNETTRLCIEESKDRAVIAFSCVVPEYYCVSEMERMMTTALARCSYILGKKIRVKEVCFQHKAPAYAESYEAFFEAPIKFEQAHCAISVPPGLLDLKIKHGNPYLLSVLSGYAEKLLKKLAPSSDIQQKVRLYIERHLADEQTLDVTLVAKELHMSRHTLYRKLKKENVSFQALVEEVKQVEAKRYLTQKDVSISEVAFLLGFSELSAFSRAFKRWTGLSPAQYRSEHSV